MLDVSLSRYFAMRTQLPIAIVLCLMVHSGTHADELEPKKAPDIMSHFEDYDVVAVIEAIRKKESGLWEGKMVKVYKGEFRPRWIDENFGVLKSRKGSRYIIASRIGHSVLGTVEEIDGIVVATVSTQSGIIHIPLPGLTMNDGKSE